MRLERCIVLDGIRIFVQNELLGIRGALEQGGPFRQLVHLLHELLLDAFGPDERDEHDDAGERKAGRRDVVPVKIVCRLDFGEEGAFRIAGERVARGGGRQCAVAVDPHLLACVVEGVERSVGVDAVMEETREVLRLKIGGAKIVELDAVGLHGGFLGVRQAVGLHEGFRQDAVGVNESQSMGLDVVVPVFVLHLIEVNVPCRFDCKTCHVGNLLLFGSPCIVLRRAADFLPWCWLNHCNWLNCSNLVKM